MKSPTQNKSDRSWKGKNIQTGESTSRSNTDQAWSHCEYRFESSTNENICTRDGTEVARWKAQDAGHASQS